MRTVPALTVLRGLPAAVRAVVVGALTLIASVAVGTLLLVGVYSLPLEPIQRSVERSVPLLEQEGLYFVAQKGVDGGASVARLDNFTDALLLNEACTPGTGTVLQNAMAVPCVRARVGADPLENVSSAGQVPEGGFIGSYARYWHGSLVVWKTLLFCGLDYAQIRVVNTCVQLVLLGAVVVVLARRSRPLLALAFCATAVAVGFWCMGLSLQYSSVYIPTLIACLLIALRPRWLVGEGAFFWLMLVMGVVVAYLDLLTFPLFSLGIPLVMRLATEGSQGDWRQSVGVVAIAACAWCTGYGGMWAAKWVLASAVLGTDVVGSALDQAKIRTSAQASETVTDTVPYLSGIKALAKRYILSGSLVVAAASLGASLCAVLTRSQGVGFRWRDWLQRSVPFVLVALTPFIWCALLRNHTFQHNFFTFRIFAVSLFALLAFLAQMGQALLSAPRPAAHGSQAPTG